MANKYLDSTGVKYLWDKIKNAYQPKGNYLSLANINGNYFNTRTYINHHPENGNGSIIPFIYNDLGHLLSKGGSCSIYTTSATDFTPDSLTAIKTVSATASLFDGSPSYQNNFSSILTAQTSGDTSLAQETLVIDITCHNLFYYSNTVYIDFGNLSWYCQSIQILTKNDSATTYTSRANVTGHTQPAYYAAFDIGSAGFNKLRIVLKNPKRNLRIAQIGVINYGSSGVNETFVSRAGTSMYGSLYPYVNKGANLGTSNNMWANIYGGTIYENGTSLSSKYLQSIPTATSSTLGSVKIQSGNVYDYTGNASDVAASMNHYHSNYLTSHQSLAGYATQTWVNTQISNLVNSAPEALNTLGELATALENHEDAYDALLSTVGGKLDKSSVSGTSGYIPKFSGTDSIGNSVISQAASNKTTIGGKLVVNAGADTSEGNCDEGIRVLPQGGWSEVFLSNNTSTTGASGWLIARRGSNGTTSGSAGDFTIEYNGHQGNGLTLYANGNRPRWKNNELAYVSDITTSTIKISLSADNGTLSQPDLVTLKARPHQVVFELGGYYYFAENLSSSATWHYSCNVYYSGSQIIKRVITINTTNGVYLKNDYTYTPPSYTLPTDPTFNSVTVGNISSVNTQINPGSIAIDGGRKFVDLDVSDGIYIYDNELDEETIYDAGQINNYGSILKLPSKRGTIALLNDTARSISYFNFDSGNTTVESIYEDWGISCNMEEIELEFEDEDGNLDYHITTGRYHIPIIAGNGITITKNDDNVAVISSTASGGSGGGLKLIDSGDFSTGFATLNTTLMPNKTYLFVIDHIRSSNHTQGIIRTSDTGYGDCTGRSLVSWSYVEGTVYKDCLAHITFYQQADEACLEIIPIKDGNEYALIHDDGDTYEIYELSGGSGGNELLVVENTAEAVEAAGGFEYLLNKYSLVAFEVEAYGRQKQSQFFKIDRDSGGYQQFDFFFFQNNMSEDTSTHTWLQAEITKDNDTAMLVDWAQFGDLVGYSPENNCVLRLLFM